jgi:glycosyltransferase involved in cell wall biosynthesis
MPPSLTVVVPMFNEEAYILRTVAAARRVLERMAVVHEIVLVDDGSTDRTGEIADGLAREDPRVKVVHNGRNRGLGGSLRAGYAAATCDLILYTDADLPFDFDEVERAVRLLEYQQADVLSAYRFDRRLEGLQRHLYTSVYSALVRVLFGIEVRDVNFAFKLFRRALLERVPLKSEGSFIDAEFLIRCRRAGAHIIQIGVDYFPRARGTSSLASPRVVGRILGEMARLWPELKR